MNRKLEHAQALELYNSGRTTEARACLQALCNQQPDNWNAHFLLGLSEAQLGNPSASADAMRLVIRLQPDNSAAHAGLGRALFELGQPADSEHCLRTALQLQPDTAPLYSDLGIALQAQKKFPAAVEAYQKAIEIDPDTLDTRFNLGVCLQHQGAYDAAVEVYRDVLARHPDHVTACINMAAALGATGRLSDAISAFQQALSLRPDDPEIGYRLALALEQTHRLQQARAVLVSILEHSPDHAAASLLLARLERRAGELEAAQHRLQAINTAGMRADMASRIHTETGRVLERLGEFEAAFDNYAKAQAGVHNTPEAISLRTRGWLEHVASLRQGITANRVSAWPDNPPSSIAPEEPAPVFLIGHPRSGTTLVEQVLGAHQRFTTNDERPVLRALADRFRQTHGEHNWIAALDTLTDDELQSLRTEYRQAGAHQAHNPADDVRLIDKNPLNLVEMAFVRRVFPEARVIMLLRDPRDVCLSCFTQLFGLNSAMVWFTSLNDTARHYAAVMDLWLHYQTVLGLNVLELRYEDFVNNLEDRAHDMFAFLGEDWDAGVLRYHEQSSRQYISTPSYEGVTTPPYTESIGRWRNFSRQLQPVLPVLQPFVNSLGY